MPELQLLSAQITTLLSGLETFQQDCAVQEQKAHIVMRTATRTEETIP